MENYEEQISAIAALSAPLEQLNAEIEQIRQTIRLSEEVGKSIEKDHPETYHVRMLATRDMEEHLNRKVAERQAYLTDMQESIKSAVSIMSDKTQNNNQN